MSFIYSLLFGIILLNLYEQCFLHCAGALTCSLDNQCQNSTVSCSSDQDECILHCTGINSCDGVTFNCNILNKACQMICDGESSCQNAQYDASSSPMVLQCNGVNSCKQMKITSTALQNTITCNATSACNTATVSVSGLSSLIQCGDYLSSCESLLYTASGLIPDAATHVLECSGSTSGCSNVIFNCTHSANECHVNCSTSESCDGSQLLCYANECSSNNVDYFSVIGGTIDPTRAPTDIPTIPSILHNYVLIDTATDWFSAQNYCQNVYESDLATITNTVDFDDIIMYFNVYNNAWIGLNNYYQNIWQWIDGEECDYVSETCEDDIRWADSYPSPHNKSCAIMNTTHQGMYSNVNCTSHYPFLCQLRKRVEYICVQSNHSITQRVFEYKEYDLYISNRSSQEQGTLMLSLASGYWSLIADGSNHILARCEINETDFILPTECDDWEWITNKTDYAYLSNLMLVDCAFNGICFPDSEVNNAYTRIMRHYDFAWFDMQANGAVYYSPGGALYLYPVTYNFSTTEARKYIASDSIQTKPDWNSNAVLAYCDIEISTISISTQYVFDINDCNEGWKSYQMEGDRTIQLSSSGCVPTPFPTGAPTITNAIHFMRVYFYYNADAGFRDRDGFNLTHFMDSFRNITLTSFYQLFEVANDGFIAEFETCDVFVDNADPENVTSTLGADRCPFVESELDSEYYAAANFKIYSNPKTIYDFGDIVMTIFLSGDFISTFMQSIQRQWGDIEIVDDGILIFNLNATTTLLPITTDAQSQTTTAWITDHFILHIIYELNPIEEWKEAHSSLFAQYLQNSTLQTFHNLFTSNDGELDAFVICAVFDDQLVNDIIIENCPYDIGASADQDEFTAIAPFDMRYNEFSSFESSAIAIFESDMFLSDLSTNMNTLLSLGTFRRLLNANFVALNVDVLDPNDIMSDVTKGTEGNDASAEIDNDDTDKHKLLRSLFQFAFLGVVSLFLILIIGSSIISTCIWINHFFRISAIITVAVQLMDMLSDVFFTVNASFGRNHADIMIIFILSACFIVLPVIITLVQLWVHMNKHWMKDDKLRSWLSENTKLLYFVSIVTGSSFSAVELFNSNLFSLSQFNMGLSRTQLMGYQYKRVYSIVVMENIPQLALQASYVIVTGGTWDIITATSMTFTIISIVVAIITMFVQKQILFNQDLVIISFDVTGACVVAKGDYCMNVIRPLHHQLCTILGLDKGVVEIVRPYNIPNGVKVQLNIHIVDNDTDSHRNMCREFESIMHVAIQSQQVQSALMNCWKLKSAPNVSNLSLENKDSKKKLRIEKSTEMVGTQINNNQETEKLSDAMEGAMVEPGAMGVDAYDDDDDDDDDGNIIAGVNTLHAHGEDDDNADSDRFEDDEIVAAVNNEVANTLGGEEGNNNNNNDNNNTLNEKNERKAKTKKKMKKGENMENVVKNVNHVSEVTAEINKKQKRKKKKKRKKNALKHKQ